MIHDNSISSLLSVRRREKGGEKGRKGEKKKIRLTDILQDTASQPPGSAQRKGQDGDGIVFMKYGYVVVTTTAENTCVVLGLTSAVKPCTSKCCLVPRNLLVPVSSSSGYQ